MLAWLVSLLAWAAPAAGPADAVPSLPDRRFVAWPHAAPAAAPISVAGITLTNTSRVCQDRDSQDHDSQDRDPDHCWVAGVRIERAGAAAVTLQGPAGMQSEIAVGAMTPGAAPTVILATFTGGAHCCEVYDVAMPDAAGWRTTRIAWTHADWQGAAGETQTEFDGGLAGFPRDLDGDGRPDFVLSDDRFDYTFSSYAGSAAPPVVLNWVDGHWVDVSASPPFAPLVEADLAKRRAGCVAAGDGEHDGVCAAFAADAARLGRLDAARPLVVAHADRGAAQAEWGLRRCPVADIAGRCPPGREVVYKDYPAALRAFLTVTGYLTAAR